MSSCGSTAPGTSYSFCAVGTFHLLDPVAQRPHRPGDHRPSQDRELPKVGRTWQGPNACRYRRTSRSSDSSRDPALAAVAVSYDARSPKDHGRPVGAWCRGANLRSAHHTRGLRSPTKPSSRSSISASTAWLESELGEMGKQGVGVGDRQPGGFESVVVEHRPTEAGHHRVVEVRVVRGVHGVQGEAYERGLYHSVVDERPVEVGGVEVGEPVPQGEIGGGGTLRL